MTSPDDPVPHRSPASDTSDFDPSAVEAAHDHSISGAPSDATTLTEVLNSLDADGFEGQFVARDDAGIECLTCEAVSPAADFIPRRRRQFEGASDPDDLVSVIATTCPVCLTGGTLVLGYGVNASALDAAIRSELRAPVVEVQVPDDARPASQPPREASVSDPDPFAPGAALVDSTLDPAEPNEPG